MDHEYLASTPQIQEATVMNLKTLFTLNGAAMLATVTYAGTKDEINGFAIAALITLAIGIVSAVCSQWVYANALMADTLLSQAETAELKGELLETLDRRLENRLKSFFVFFWTGVGCFLLAVVLFAIGI